MERLTKTYSDGTHGASDSLPCGENSYDYKNLLIERLGKYEDLEEQGRLIKLPCKVGDMLYYPDKEFNIIIPMRLTEIVIKFNGLDTSSCQYDCCSFDECGDAYEDYEFDDEDIGETVFLAKSEAEAKLKELRGNND